MITELTENSINNLNNKEWHHFLSLVTQSEWLGCLAEEKMEAFWGLENQEKFQEYFSQEIYKWWLEQDEDLKDLVIILNTCFFNQDCFGGFVSFRIPL